MIVGFTCGTVAGVADPAVVNALEVVNISREVAAYLDVVAQSRQPRIGDRNQVRTAECWNTRDRLCRSQGIDDMYINIYNYV